MSKWSSARSDGARGGGRGGVAISTRTACLFAAFAGIALLAACDRDGRLKGLNSEPTRSGGAPITRSDTRVDDVATGEPGKDRHQWRAAGSPARELTGNLTASLEMVRSGPTILAFATGVTLRLSVIDEVPASAAYFPGAGDFAKLLGADPAAGVYIYKVLDEHIDRSAPLGGLCRDRPTTFVAISEYVGRSGEWAFRTAAFGGDGPPGPSADGDPQFCALYQYALASQ